MEGRNLVDVSSFFLFESSGDSEADSYLNVDSLIENVDVDMDMTKVDEDAESFCCNSSECVRVDEFQDFDHYREDVSFYDNNRQHADEDDDDDEDEDAIDQEWSWGKVMLGQHKKSMVYVDSSVEKMNKRDNDRHFWEACLTS